MACNRADQAERVQAQRLDQPGGSALQHSSRDYGNTRPQPIPDPCPAVFRWFLENVSFLPLDGAAVEALTTTFELSEFHSRVELGCESVASASGLTTSDGNAGRCKKLIRDSG